MKTVLPMIRKEMIMIKKILLISTILSTLSYTEIMQDQDFDGVPDALDQCKDTPFLNEVDQYGCTTKILTLPFETDKESMTMTLGYGYSTNEDLIDRAEQRNTKVKISYFIDNWSFTVQTGYYTHNFEEGTLDTILRLRKRIKLNSQYVLSIGTGIRLPTYDFEGNKLDELFYGSLHYYPTTSLSFIAGYLFTHIGDDDTSAIYPETPSGDEDDDGNEYDVYQGLQDKHKFYAGVGYFFTDNFYMNLIYSDERSKFVGEHRIKTISTSIYYKIDEKWFTTLYYKHELFDEDLHNNLLFTIGYTFW